MTGSSNHVGSEGAGQYIGVVPGGGPPGRPSSVAYWHLADIEAELAEVTAAGAADKPHFSVLNSEPRLSRKGDYV